MRTLEREQIIAFRLRRSYLAERVEKERLLQPHDKSTIVPDKTLHSRIWRIVGNPGVVLVDGEISGVWRPRKRGRILNLSVELFRPVSPSTRRQIGQEASRLARLRDSKLGEIQYV